MSMFVLGVIVGALIVLTAFCAAVPGYNEVIRTEEREKLYRALKNLPPFTVSVEEKNGYKAEFEISKETALWK